LNSQRQVRIGYLHFIGLHTSQQVRGDIESFVLVDGGCVGQRDREAVRLEAVHQPIPVVRRLDRDASERLPNRLTDLQVDLQVYDMRAGRSRRYFNALGRPFRPIQDTSAFDTCP
jgi:hypothetical protein